MMPEQMRGRKDSMGLTSKELAKRDDFDAQYRQGQLPVVQAVERAVCGCDYGGTSWATRDEADRIAAALELAPGVRLLEVGAGSGWPALYLAGQSGCDVTLTDLPLEGIRIAAGRAARDRLPGTCLAVVADAAQLPFRDGCFDVINHSDVLCCLVQKREVLAECRRVVRPGGQMAFSVIYIAEGLSAGDHARAAETAPEFAESDASYPTLLAETGWAIRQRHDLTAEFMANCQQKLHAEEGLRAELEPLSTVADFDATQARMRRRLAVLEQRHLRRELFIVEPAE
jgi:ubiquinone/menaquinone biosynthesis C-methylase UbiE